MPDPILGRNQAMRQMLKQSQEDETEQICDVLVLLRGQISSARLPPEKLNQIKFNANELLHKIQKELMSGKIDPRVPCAVSRSGEERTSATTD